MGSRGPPRHHPAATHFNQHHSISTNYSRNEFALRSARRPAPPRRRAQRAVSHFGRCIFGRTHLCHTLLDCNQKGVGVEAGGCCFERRTPGKLMAFLEGPRTAAHPLPSPSLSAATDGEKQSGIPRNHPQPSLRPLVCRPFGGRLGFGGGGTGHLGAIQAAATDAWLHGYSAKKV